MSFDDKSYAMFKVYEPIAPQDVPANVVFDVPVRHQGRAWELAYGGPSPRAVPWDEGAPYKRVTRDGKTLYLRWCR